MKIKHLPIFFINWESTTKSVQFSVALYSVLHTDVHIYQPNMN